MESENVSDGSIEGNDQPIKMEWERELPILQENSSGVYDFDNVVWILTSATAVLYSIYLISYGLFRPVQGSIHVVISLGLTLAIVFLINMKNTEYEGLRRRFDLGFLLISTIAAISLSIYFYLSIPSLLNRLLQYTQIEYVAGGLILLVVLEGTRRSFGWVLSFAILLAVAHALWGNWLPGIFNHSGIPISRFIEISVLTVSRGIYGQIPIIASTWIAIFLVYVGMLMGYDALDFVMGLASWTANKSIYILPQITVISSFIMGSLSGSAAANVATTGSFTIPILKRQGFKGKIAAAFEASASSGGQIMPPIMGAAAFLMASLLSIPYSDIIIYGTLPAILFFGGVGLSVLFVTINEMNKDALIANNPDTTQQRPSETTESNSETTASESSNGFETGQFVWYEHIPSILSIAYLVYALMVVRLSPLSAGINSIFVVVGAQYIWQAVLSDNIISSLKETSLKTLRGLQIGAVEMAPLLVTIAGIIIFIVGITTGPFTQRLTFMMLDASSILIILLLLSAALSLVFGMGLPTVAAYIIVVILIAPAAIEFGVQPVTTHFFVFYFAILSALTPPVALASLVASGVAKSDFMATSFEAIKVSLPAWILPFAFVYNDNLLFWDIYTIPVFVSLLIGFAGLTYGVNMDTSSWYLRIVSTITGIIFIVLPPLFI